MNSIEARFGPLANEIMEEVYVSEVLQALEMCMDIVTDRQNDLMIGRGRILEREERENE